MDHPQDIESTLNALLLNAQKMNDVPSAQLNDEQSHLLDTLFKLWFSMSDAEQASLLSSQIEDKLLTLAKKNHACLRTVAPLPRPKTTHLKTKQLELDLS